MYVHGWVLGITWTIFKLCRDINDTSMYRYRKKLSLRHHICGILFTLSRLDLEYFYTCKLFFLLSEMVSVYAHLCTLPCFQKPLLFFCHFEKNYFKVLPLRIFVTNGNIHILPFMWVYVSYIHSRTMYLVPMERAWKDNSNHTKYIKSSNGK